MKTKKLLTFTVLAAMSILLLTGCNINVWGTQGGFHAHWEGYRPAKPSLLVHHYGGWKPIGYVNPEEPRKGIWTLNRTDTEFMIGVGHPPNFDGHVSEVLVSVDDFEPVTAAKERNGSNYRFWCFIGSRPYSVAGFGGLSPGNYTIKAEIYWTMHRGPNYRGPKVVDKVTTVYGRFRIVPGYSP